MSDETGKYLQAFAKLRIVEDRERWAALTTFRPPLKPFLLLAVLDLISRRIISRNFIEPSSELASTFNDYWQRIMPEGTIGNPAYAFLKMAEEPFWRLEPIPGVVAPEDKTIDSMKHFREFYIGAKLEDELFPALLLDHLRERLRAVLITTYFAPEFHSVFVAKVREGQSPGLPVH